MKRFIKLIAVLLICSFCAGIVEPAAVNAESTVAINKTKATVMVGETLQLKITGTTDKVTWESSDSDIAKVSSTGKVAGVKAGLATITATVTSKNYSCVVTVNDKDFTVKDGVLTKYNGKSKSVTIPNSVTTIGKNAFKGNKTLESVEIPSTVKSIETLAFVDCINLSAITIPDTVKSIGLGAFYNTKWLSQQQKKDTLVIVNGILIDGITSTGTVTVPDTVTSIGPGAFSNYKRIKVAASTITEIILPDTVTGIGEKAFYGCMKLESITIPDSVTDIGNKAFYICGNLILDVTEGSYLHSYAKKQGVRFRLVKSDNTSDDGKDTGKTEPTPIPSDGGNYYPSDGSSNICTVRFYDGSRFIEGNSVYKGAPLGRVPSVERTSKENAIFVGWYTDTALTQPFYPDNKVTDDMKVYAKYTDLPGETLNITSFALLDQSPDLSFEIVRAANAATAPEDAFTLVTKDGSDVVPLRWEVADDTYTVYADNGFREGCSYELTIANGYFFKGKADTIRTVSFTIAMAEVDNLKMSDEIIYIQDTAEMQYNIPGQAGPVDVLIPSLVPETGGTFTYDGAASLQPGDILCFYIATNPKDRDYLNYSYIDDPEVYVEVENITGNTVTFGALEDEDMELLYNVPDNFPILVAELPTGDIGTININGLDLETYVSILGPTDGTLDNAKAKVSVGDFVSLYTAAYKSAYSAGESTSENDVYYGEVTAYNSITGEITYRITTEKAIEDAMNLYITPDVNGDDLLNEDDRVALEAQLLEQVKKSSFAEDAAFMLADLATKTDGFRSNESIQSLLLSDKDGNPLSEDEIALLNLGASFELTDDIGITVELVTSGDQLHYDNGVQLAIGIDATFEVEIEDEGKVAIDLSASFVEEIALGVNVKGSLVKKKILGIPIPIGVEVNSAVEIKNYTAVNFNVNIYTVAPEEQSTWEKLKDLMADTRVGEVLDKIEELQSKIDQVKEDVETIRGYIQDVESMWQSITTNENNPRVWMETLHKTNITKELMDMMNLSTETGIQSGKYAESMEDLMQKYSEMLETETEWIELINKEIFRFEACYFGLAVSVSGNFITRADINIAMGSSLEYEVGKRYTFWFKIGLFTPTAGSSTMDLIDERFAFQFYVMGKERAMESFRDLQKPVRALPDGTLNRREES